MSQYDAAYDYDAMRSMANCFKMASQQFEQLGRSIEQLAGVLEDGALLGNAGDRLVNTLRSSLTQKASQGAAKFEELAGDIASAIGEMSDSDQQAASGFGR